MIREEWVYIIDFGYSVRLDAGPGRQTAVDLPNTVWKRPRDGMTRFDPYAWDMFCLGNSFSDIIEVHLLFFKYGASRLTPADTIANQ